MANLRAGYQGDIVPVNPNRDEVLGLSCVDDLTETSDIDLAVVIVPPQVVLDVVRQAGEVGVRNVVVITAGFRESGGEGPARERELRDIATEYNMDLVGPNCVGVIGTSVGLNATFAPVDALRGSISLMSQSGAFITAALDWARDQEIGFNDVVSMGNKAVLDETDFIEAWGDDPDTDVILGYLESIENGHQFLETARKVTQETPVVVVKSGRTEAGAQAASSHTGAIAGSDRAYEAALKQAGVLRIDSVQEFFEFARVLAGQPLPASDGVGIVTNAGGLGVMTTDAVGDSRLSLASLAPETIETLSGVLPEGANIYNPIDIIGDADADRFQRALEVVLSDAHVGSVVVLSAPSAVLSYDKLAAATTSLQIESDKPIVACMLGGERTRSAEQYLRETGIPNYFDPTRAVCGLEALAEYRDITEREYESPVEFDVDRACAREILAQVEAREDNRLGVEAMSLLDAYGISVPSGEIVESPTAAVTVAERIDGPVVMKIVSPDILHKSDIGGVRVGVPLEEVADTFDNLVTRADIYQPGARIIGVQVQEKIDLSAGVETIVGMNRDPQFGPLVMFGLGGIFVEVFQDTTFRVAPVSEREAHEMTDEIRAAPLLRGARGRPPVVDRLSLRQFSASRSW
jgi:acetate---CoA ligase (ADP-forming)